MAFGRKFRRDVRGVTAIEYGLLVALIIIACIAALSLTGTNIKSAFAAIGQGMESAVATYPDNLPYQGLGIAPPSGLAVYSSHTSEAWSGSSPGYTVNGQLYSQVDPDNTGFTVYADGYTATPSSVSESSFKSACSGSGGSGNNGLITDYTPGTFSIAPNGNYVCGNSSLARISGGTLQQNVNYSGFYNGNGPYSG